ncbi:MAG: hypothetical protein AAB373_05025 [Patescibacteria group bacterium]
MTEFNTLIIAIGLASIIFCFIALKRLISYNKRFHLPESKYTKLFKVISKEQVGSLYLLLTIFSVISVIIFTISFNTYAE